MLFVTISVGILSEPSKYLSGDRFYNASENIIMKLAIPVVG